MNERNVSGKNSPTLQVEHAIQRTPELDIDKGVLHAGEDGESSLIGAIMKK